MHERPEREAKLAHPVVHSVNAGPYRKLRESLALVAITPPTEADHSVGSGGKNWFCLAAAL